MKVTLRDIIDISIVAYVIYRIMGLIKGTRAATIMKGMGVLFFAFLLSDLLEFRTLSFVFQRSATMVLVALPVVFYPELRRALEHIGRGKLFHKNSPTTKEDWILGMDTVVQAAFALSKKKVGALIVLAQETGLNEYIETGTRLDAVLSDSLLQNIFEPNSPLHDGAVILRHRRIVSAACLLPLTDSRLDSSLGTRHRAAVGISEQTDALVIVVSEETGTVSLAKAGRLRRYLSESRLRELLHSFIKKEVDPTFFARRRKK